MDAARTKRLMLVELFVFLTLAGTTALVFQPIMALINRNITIVREQIIKQAETILNRPIRYGSLGPSIVRAIDIRDVSAGNETTPLLAADHLYLEYSLWGILRGKGIKAVRSLILEKPAFDFDTERDKDLQQLFSDPSRRISGRKSIAAILPAECLVLVREGSISITHRETVYSVTGIDLRGEIKDHQITLEGDWQKDRLQDGTITLEGSVNGSFEDTLTSGNVEINIDSVEGELFLAERIGFALSFFDDRIVAERKDDGRPLELSALYFHESGDFSFSFRADNFLPSSLVHFKGPLERISPLLSLGLSGNARLSRKGTPKDFEDTISCDFSISGKEASSANAGTAGREAPPIRGFIMEGKGNEKLFAFSRVEIDANRGSAVYTGDIQFNPPVSRGTLRFSDFSISGDTGVNGSIVLVKDDRSYRAAAPYVSFGETVLSSFAGELTDTKDGGSYSLTFDRYREREEGFFKTSFGCGGSYSEDPGGLEGNVEFNGFFLDDLNNIARPFLQIGSIAPRITQRTSLTANIGFKTDFKGFSYQTRHFKAAYGPENFVSLSVTGDEQHLELSEGIIQWRQGRAAFDFSADFSRAEDVLFNCGLDYLDFNYGFDGNLRNGKNLTIRGNHNFLAAIVNEEGRWSGSVSGRAIPVPFNGSRSYLSLDAAMVYLNSSAWNVKLNHFEIEGGRGEFSAGGQANQNGLNFDRISYTDQGGTLSGSATAIWNNDFSVIDASFFLSDQNETEKLAGDVFYESGNLEFHGNVSDFKGERIAAAAKNFRFSGEFYGALSGEGYYLVNLSLDSLTGRIAGKDFSLSGLILLDPERLIISQLLCNLGNVQSNIHFISLDRDAGSLEAESQITGIVNNQELGLQMSLGFNFRPMKNWLDVDALAALSGILGVRYAYINQKETAEPFNFIFTRTPLIEDTIGPALYRLSGGPDDMLNAEFRESSPGNGVFSLSLQNPSPAQGFITGFLEGTNIDALASEVYIDLAGLWDLIPVNKIANFTGGIITGETRVFGSIFDPEFDGTAWGSGIRLTIPDYIPAEIGPGSGIVTLEGSGFSFGPVDSPCGDGHGILYAAFNFNRWKTSFDLNIEVDRNVPFDFNLLGIISNGNAGGTINFYLEEGELLTITGDLDISDTEITLNKEEIERAVSGTNQIIGPDVVTDIKITAGKRVEFLWPDSRNPLLRAYGETLTGVRINSDTRIPRFLIDGEITLRGGELYHLSRNFYIREGRLQFIGSDLNIEPLLSARAEIRDNNEDGPVTIMMIMDNVPLSQLEKTMPRFESIPSLSQFEIYSLLGQAPDPNMEANPSDALYPVIRAGTEILLQPLIFRRVETAVRNILGLDMFTFRTQMLQNYIYEAVRTRNREPDEKPPTIGNYLDNTSVFMGKYIGPDLFFQTILSFRYNQYRQDFGGMWPDLDMGLDFRTPLFDIRWNVRPLDPENLSFSIDKFVSGQSISIIWRWSL